jgi:hypothetical protein
MTNTNYSLTIDQAQRIAKEAGVVLEPRDGTEQNFDVVDAEGDRLNDFTYSRHDIRSMSEREWQYEIECLVPFRRLCLPRIEAASC